MGFTFSDLDGSLYWDRGSEEGRELSLDEARIIAATQQASALRYVGDALHAIAEAIDSVGLRLEPKDR